MAWQAESSLRLADRRKLLLTLGAPYALLLLASLVAWPWRALDVPGTIGTLTPPSFVLLVFTLSASTYAMRRRLPLSMITWLPAGQGAIVLLATGFFAGGTPNELTGLAFIVSYVFIFLIVLALTTAIASNGGPIAISFMGFFVFTQAMRFPIFEVATDGPVPAASFFTLVAVTLAAAEVVVLGMAGPQARRSGGRVHDTFRPLDHRVRARTRRPRGMGGTAPARNAHLPRLLRAGSPLAHTRGYPTRHGSRAHQVPPRAIPGAGHPRGRPR